MGYEVFVRTTQRSGPAAISITPLGRLAFNKSATARLQKEAVEQVLLLWDAEAKKFAVRASNNKKDPRTYKLAYGKKGNGAGFSAVTFLDHINYDWSKRRIFNAEWNDAESMFEIHIPAEFLQGRPRLTQLEGGKKKYATSTK